MQFSAKSCEIIKAIAIFTITFINYLSWGVLTIILTCGLFGLSGDDWDCIYGLTRLFLVWQLLVYLFTALSLRMPTKNYLQFYVYLSIRKSDTLSESLRERTRNIFL